MVWKPIKANRPDYSRRAESALFAGSPATPEGQGEQAPVVFLFQGEFADVDLAAESAGDVFEQVVAEDGGRVDRVDRQDQEVGSHEEQKLQILRRGVEQRIDQ